MFWYIFASFNFHQFSSQIVIQIYEFYLRSFVNFDPDALWFENLNACLRRIDKGGAEISIVHVLHHPVHGCFDTWKQDFCQWLIIPNGEQQQYSNWAVLKCWRAGQNKGGGAEGGVPIN